VLGFQHPPLLLLHDNSQNHATWFGVASRLAERYQVVLADLRGYGDSSLPDPRPNHINYSSGVLAADMFDVMGSLGHQRFFLAGHDRGARVSLRVSLDQPDRIMKVCILAGRSPNRLTAQVCADHTRSVRRTSPAQKSNAGLSFLTSSYGPRRHRQEPACSQKLSVNLVAARTRKVCGRETFQKEGTI
jgi:pimeloyl-ACP methyl ester carboxylesterase